MAFHPNAPYISGIERYLEKYNARIIKLPSPRTLTVLLPPPPSQTSTNTTPRTTKRIPRARRTSSKNYRGQRGGKGALDRLGLESICTKTAMREANLAPCLEHRDTAKKNCKQCWTPCTEREEGGNWWDQGLGGKGGGDQTETRVTPPSCFVVAQTHHQFSRYQVQLYRYYNIKGCLGSGRGSLSASLEVNRKF